MLDLNGSQLQKDIVDIVSAMKLPNAIISFHASPGKGFFIPMPCDLIIFDPDSSKLSIGAYARKHKKTYTEAHFVYVANNFYFHEKINVLEIPKEKYVKYLTRCLMTNYLEFNKNRVSQLIRESFQDPKSA